LGRVLTVTLAPIAGLSIARLSVALPPIVGLGVAGLVGTGLAGALIPIIAALLVLGHRE
jgi:hypothetical protein